MNNHSMDTIHDLDTPSLIVDLDVMEANLAGLQNYCDHHGIGLRPHIKTHKIPALAQKQLDLGAVGIACQKLAEAEVMADAGLLDIMIPYNIVGQRKLERLAALARRAQITVSVDSIDVAQPIAEYLHQQGLTVKAVIELTSELNRCGVTTVEAALDLAREIDRSRGLLFQGIMVYPSSLQSMPLVTETLAVLQAARLSVEMVSGGSSPTAYRSHEFLGLTEIRAGTYIFNDCTYLRKEICRLEQCALKVITTVISTPTADRVIIDGGMKTFSSDMGLPMGYIVEYPEAHIYQMSEEHGFIDVSQCSRKPKIGERITVIPNHACGTINMHDMLVGLRGEAIEAQWEIAARGKIQ
jgi:D-serine deaminase-like pyridoxal phosphate-dependent protein